VSEESDDLILPPTAKVGLWVGCDAILDCTVSAWADLKHLPEGTRMKISISPVLPIQNGDNPGMVF